MNFKTIFKKLFLWFYEVKYDSDLFKEFKSSLICFYDYYSDDWHFNNYRITKCRLYNFPNKMIVEIHSLSPGMIIGKSGKCIDALKFRLEKVLSKPIEINLQETNPFK